MTVHSDWVDHSQSSLNDILLPSKNTTYINQQLEKIFKILATCFGCKKPSSGQNGTQFRYKECVHIKCTPSLYPHVAKILKMFSRC